MACHLSLRNCFEVFGRFWRVHDSGSASLILFLSRYGWSPVNNIQWSKGMLCSFWLELRCICNCLKNMMSAVPSGVIMIGPDQEKWSGMKFSMWVSLLESSLDAMCGSFRA